MPDLYLDGKVFKEYRGEIPEWAKIIKSRL